MAFMKFFNRKLALCSQVKDNLEGDKVGEQRRRRRQKISFLQNPKPKAPREISKVLEGMFLSFIQQGNIDSIDDSTDSTSKTASWRSCDSPDYKRCSMELLDEDKAAMWAKAIQDSRRLPQASHHFSNNHIMVNAERAKRCAPALKRMRDLDAAARWHAEKMAAANEVFHANADKLLSMLETPSDYLGENVGRGKSIQEIHEEMMENKSDVYNMSDRRYREMGMATAKGKDGNLYLCQIFRC